MKCVRFIFVKVNGKRSDFVLLYSEVGVRYERRI